VSHVVDRGGSSRALKIRVGGENPSKAPWYFLGLQEMLVYYDPWMAGVVLPSLIIVGMMAIPYIDFNKLGNGYYTYNERKFAIITYLFGFLPLWVAMIILGTFLRGPNWNFSGRMSSGRAQLEFLNNVNLSEMFCWTAEAWPCRGRPAWGCRSGIRWGGNGGWWRLRPTCSAPPVMAAMTKKFFIHWLYGMVFANLVREQYAADQDGAPLVFNLKYIVAIQNGFLTFSES
jgi:hypothetical protein